MSSPPRFSRSPPPGSAVARLIDTHAAQFTELLEELGPDRDLVEEAEPRPDDWVGWRLWSAPVALPDIGPTRASKLYARKRPRLGPIYDTVVADVIGRTDIWSRYARPCKPIRASTSGSCACEMRPSSRRPSQRSGSSTCACGWHGLCGPLASTRHPCPPDRLETGAGRARVLVLPDAHHQPAGVAQPRVGVGVPCLHAVQLPPPPFAVVGREVQVARATVPEAPVHEDRHLGPGESDVDGSPWRCGHGDLDPEAQSSGVHRGSERQLGSRTGATDAAHQQ